VISRALVLLFLGSSSVLFSGTDNINQSGNSVIAEVDGIKLTLADFERRRPEALFQARNAFYETEKKAVEEFIDSYLLERRAQEEHVTVAQLLERHVNSTIAKDPDDTALRVYYEGIDTNEPFEAVRGKILEILRQRRAAKAKSAYMQELRNEAKITIAVAPPRAQISLDNARVRGAAGAPLTLVEFADYECPYCQQMQPALSQLEADYKGKLAFAYKDVPLPMHAHAQKAAEAAHCAGVQNKYWEYHDLLLKTKALELTRLKSVAGDLALDTKAFDKCLDSGEQLETVKASMDEAQRLGIQGTPSFFLNGRFFSGILTYTQLRQIVEEELKRTIVQPQQTVER
jgi:protein-disulfide isomerase